MSGYYTFNINTGKNDSTIARFPEVNPVYQQVVPFFRQFHR